MRANCAKRPTWISSSQLGEAEVSQFQARNTPKEGEGALSALGAQCSPDTVSQVHAVRRPVFSTPPQLPPTALPRLGHHTSGFKFLQALVAVPPSPTPASRPLPGMVLNLRGQRESRRPDQPHPSSCSSWHKSLNFVGLSLPSARMGIMYVKSDGRGGEDGGR